MEYEKIDEARYYSLAWEGQFLGDDSLEFLLNILPKSKTVPEAFQKMHEAFKEGYTGIALNALFADTSGNIGF